MTEEFQEKCKEIMEKVRSNSSSLHISRIPIETRKEFVELADKVFSSDFGMALKWCLDFRKGLLTSPNEQVLAQLDILAQEIAGIKVRLNSSEKKEEHKEIRTVSGKVIRRGGKEHEQTS